MPGNKKSRNFRLFICAERFELILEVPAGFEPAITELQSIALATWLRDLTAQYIVTYYRALSRYQRHVNPGEALRFFQGLNPAIHLPGNFPPCLQNT